MTDFEQKPPDDEDEGFPEVGDVLSISTPDKDPRILQVAKDHGAARLYTMVDSDDEEHLVVIDENQMVHEIIAKDDE